MDVFKFLQEIATPGANLVSDSRAVAAGDIFCAIAGSSHDGHDHIASVIECGAAAVLWEPEGHAWQAEWNVPNLAVQNLRNRLGELGANFYTNPGRQLEVIAVTGTKGKTTVAVWCAQLLRAVGKPTGYIGTLGSDAGDGELVATGLTTPATLDLQRLLADFIEQGCQAVALEASSHGLAQQRLAGIDCDVAVFTNLGTDHLDHHASLEDYLAAKKLLFTRPELQGVVINGDDPQADRIVDASSATVLRCGSTPSCQLRWQLLEQSAQGCQVKLHFEEQQFEFTLPVPGEFNVSNAALAAGAALLAGVPWVDLATGLAALRCLPGRLQRVGQGSINGYVDYAHTPEALRAALSALRAAFPDSRLHCVFGCGGMRDRGKRPLMGAIAAELADTVIVTNDNPRDEDPVMIANEIIAGMEEPAAIELDRAAAITNAVAGAIAGDVVLVAGKGHEQGMQLAAGELRQFDDVSELDAALAAA